MKKILFTLLPVGALVLMTTRLQAQDKKDNTIKLEDLKLTNAPAFSLLDISPSSIESPATTKAFAASVANTFGHGNGIPQNYAMEFTPFWFIGHPQYSNYKYFGVDAAGKSLPFSQARLFSVSFALINEDSTTNVGKLANHNAGFGLRTTLVRVFDAGTRQSIVRISDGWYNALQVLSRRMQGERPSQGMIDSFKLAYGDSIKALLQTRPLFSLDAAAATNIAFPTNSFGSNHLSRTGIWLNANLALPLDKKGSTDDYFIVSAIGRYIANSDSLDAKASYVHVNLFDYGLKTEFQLGKLSLAYEYIRRTTSDKSVGNTFKSVGLLQYKVRDGLFLTGAFGQNFSKTKNLITTIGINWGISNGKEKIE